MRFMYNPDRTAPQDQPDSFKNPPGDYEERVLAMIDYMLPRLTDRPNPMTPAESGCEFVFLENHRTYMAPDYAMIMLQHLKDNNLVDAELVMDEHKQYIFFPGIEAFELKEILNTYCRTHARPVCAAIR